MDITGILRTIGAIQQVSEKFSKIEFVVTDNSSQYPQHISFQLSNNNIDLIDNYSLGDTITVYFSIRGRLWTSPKGEEKYFNTLEAYIIEGDLNGHKDNKAEIKPTSKSKSDDQSDLPF